MKLPKPTDAIIIQDVGSDCIVYDPHEATTHLLHKPVAVVLKACAGNISEREMLECLTVSPEVDQWTVVEKILQELESLKLVQPSSVKRPVAASPSRRKFLKGATMAATPLIISAIAPAPVAAISCKVNCAGSGLGAPCNPATGCTSLCLFQYTCNDLVNDPFVSCDPASSCLSGDLKNPVLLCRPLNGTNIQLSCTAARAAAVITLANQGSYICQDCP